MCPSFDRAVSSVVEHCLHTAGVASSKLAPPTKNSSTDIPLSFSIFTRPGVRSLALTSRLRDNRALPYRNSARMTPAEINLIEVAKRYTSISIQVAQAYETAQAKLNLGAVLSPARLAFSAGTQQSLEAIDDLAALTETHKVALEKVFLACATDLSNALLELSESQREEYRTGLMKTVHWHLAAQSQFYANRGRWIEAAREICNLVEARRDNTIFDGESIVFREDADHDRFTSLFEVVEDTQRIEEEHMQQMLERFSSSAAALGMTPQQ